MTEQFTSVYYHRETNKKFLAKRLDGSTLKIFDPETGIISEKTRAEIQKNFRFCKKESKQYKFGELRRF